MWTTKKWQILLSSSRPVLIISVWSCNSLILKMADVEITAQIAGHKNDGTSWSNYPSTAHGKLSLFLRYRLLLAIIMLQLIRFVCFFIFIIKATVSAPCEPCMSCRLVSHCFSHVYMHHHLTNKTDGWMDGSWFSSGSKRSYTKQCYQCSCSLVCQFIDLAVISRPAILSVIFRSVIFQVAHFQQQRQNVAKDSSCLFATAGYTVTEDLCIRDRLVPVLHLSPMYTARTHSNNYECVGRGSSSPG